MEVGPHRQIWFRLAEDRQRIEVRVDRLSDVVFFRDYEDDGPVDYPELLFIKEIARRHGVPSSIVLDRVKMLVSKYW